MPAVGHFARYITINASCWTKSFTVLRAKGKKKEADQQADFWQLEGLEFPLMTVKCCKCFAVKHVCCNDLGVCVGSTPLTYSICHHVTHLQFNYQHLSPRELPSFRFLPASSCSQSCGGLLASCQFITRPQWKTNHHWHSQNPTRENLANHRNFCLTWKLSVKEVPPPDNSGILERRQITALFSTALIPHTSVASFE